MRQDLRGGTLWWIPKCCFFTALKSDNAHVCMYYVCMYVMCTLHEGVYIHTGTYIHVYVFTVCHVPV